MADTEREDKTEEPTDRRREETRERGSIARSADLNAAALAVGTTGALSFYGGEVVQTLQQVLRSSLSEPWVRVDVDGVQAYFWKVTIDVLTVLAPMFGVLMLATAGAAAMQAGFHLSLDAIQPNWSRINPLSGFQRMFSLQGAMRVVSGMLKILILGAVAGAFVMSQFPQFMASAALEPGPLALLTGQSLLAISFQLSLALGILATLDYGYQWWQFEQSLKMTKQELRDEMKNMDGNQQMKQRRRETQRKANESAQVQQAGKADFFVTNPTEIAVGIKYDPAKMEAPIVVAKGMGPLAQRLRQIAAEKGIPIIEKKPLARALYFDVKVGHPIPSELYAAVAEILAYVMQLSGKQSRGRGK